MGGIYFYDAICVCVCVCLFRDTRQYHNELVDMIGHYVEIDFDRSYSSD